MKDKKHILVAPLNWGLGHATRCVPIIRALLKNNYDVTIASDGQALSLLQKEFPLQEYIKLPSYNITYPEKGTGFKHHMLKMAPQIIKAIRAEQKLLKKLIKDMSLDGIISDNRLGLYTSKIPAVYLTHQITVLSGKTTWLSSLLHRYYINKYSECWVPDIDNEKSLSGILGHPDKKLNIDTKYIGPLSRMTARKEEIIYKAIAIISGPEPQRSQLQAILIKQLKKLNGKVLLVEGKIASKQKKTKKGNITTINYLTSSDLEKAIAQSEFVITRSGYSSIMDLSCLDKKVFFIPTPGQFEQEYLAHRFKKQSIAPFAVQEKFKIKNLSKLSVYKGFNNIDDPKVDLSDFFGFFEGKRKLRPHSWLALNIHLFFVRLNNMLNNREPQT